MIRIWNGLLFLVDYISKLLDNSFQSINLVVRPIFLGFLDSCSHFFFSFFSASFIGISFYRPCVSQGNKSYTNSSNLSCLLNLYNNNNVFLCSTQQISIHSVRCVIIERLPSSLLDNLRNDSREQCNLLPALSSKR